MVKFAEVLERHTGFADAFRKFDVLELCKSIAALLCCPECQANTLRLEVLAHLALALADGEAKPSPESVIAITEEFGPGSPAALAEDPPEDVFVGYIASALGGFRVLNGLLPSGESSIVQLLNILSSEDVPRSVTRLIVPVRALLRLSDAMCGRFELKRYQEGSGRPGESVAHEVAKRYLDQSYKLSFSIENLRDLGLTLGSLTPFTFDSGRRSSLLSEQLWNTTLEERPLLQKDNVLTVLHPTAIPRACQRFILLSLRDLGSLDVANGDFANRHASCLAREFTKRMEVKLQDTTALPSTPLCEPFVGRYDEGQYVLVLPVTADFQVELNDPATSPFQTPRSLDEPTVLNWINTVTSRPDFASGLLLISYAQVAKEFLGLCPTFHRIGICLPLLCKTGYSSAGFVRFNLVGFGNSLSQSGRYSLREYDLNVSTTCLRCLAFGSETEEDWFRATMSFRIIKSS